MRASWGGDVTGSQPGRSRPDASVGRGGRALSESRPVCIARERGRNSRAEVIPHGLGTKRAKGTPNVAASCHSIDQTSTTRRPSRLEVVCGESQSAEHTSVVVNDVRPSSASRFSSLRERLVAIGLSQASLHSSPPPGCRVDSSSPMGRTHG
jgi:hypothetical protein